MEYLVAFIALSCLAGIIGGSLLLMLGYEPDEELPEPIRQQDSDTPREE